MNDSKRTIYVWGVFSVFLILQLLLCGYFGSCKTNLFGDEIWTFNFANHYYEPYFYHDGGFIGRWLDSGFWKQVVVVQPNETFNYGSVFFNLAQDNHPPLHCAIIHTICSFFPGQFSLWFGIIPNMVLFVGTQILLLKLSFRLFENKWLALMPCIIYGFSWGAINTVVFIRMYMLLTFWGILAFYLHLLLYESIDERKLSKRILIALIITTACGFLSQYFYAIYAFFLSMGFAFYLLHVRRYTDCGKYCVCMCGGILVGIAVFPAFIQQLLQSDRGMQTASNLMDSPFLLRANLFGGFINIDLFGRLLPILILIVAIYFLVKLLRHSYAGGVQELCEKCSMSVRKHKNFVFVWMAFVIVGTFVAVAKLAPLIQARYLYMIYPLICLFGFKLFYEWLSSIFVRKVACLIIMVFILLTGVEMYHVSNLAFSYTFRHHDRLESIISKEYPDIGAIIVTHEDACWPMVSYTLNFWNVKQTYILDETDLGTLNDILEQYQKGHRHLLVYIADNVKGTPDQVAVKLSQITPYHQYETVDNSTGKTYLFSGVGANS